MRKLSFILFFLLINYNYIFSQTSISGFVTDKQKEKISNANIVLKDSTGILSYCYSDQEGNYNLEVDKIGKFALSFSALGYKTSTITLIVKNNETKIIKNVVLEEQPFELNEIIITSEKTIQQKKDTVEIKIDRFLKPNDATVEDLLKKIPGVSVDSEGTIKIGNKEIEKLMVDGDDFFDKGYKILSKNMPPDQLEKIQILQRFSNNKLLKDIEETNNVAVNLVLKENAKRHWFGNFTAGYGLISENRYELKTYAMNFGKKNKYILLSNLNNLGYDTSGDINHLIYSMRFDEPASIGDNQRISNLLDLNFNTNNFKKSRTNFNNAELISLNAIFNPTSKLKIKTLGFFNWDETNFFRNSITAFTANNTNFTNTEVNNTRNIKQTAFGKLDIIYNFSNKKMLESTTKYNNGDFFDGTHLLFNGNSTLENLKHQNTLFDQKINFTNKLSNKKVLLLTGRFIKENAPQNYAINQYYYNDLFQNQNTLNNVKQESKNQMTFGGINAHILDRKENKNLFELQLGNAFRKDNLNTKMSLFNNDDLITNPIEYANNTTYIVNDLYFKSKYLLTVKNLKLTGNLHFHQLFNTLENNNFKQTQNPFFINPSFRVDLEINSKNKISSTYNINKTNAKVLDVFSNYALTGFRSFTKGTGTFNQLSTSNFTLNYQLGNWSDRFFANTYIMYTKNHDFFSTNAIITQNYTQTEKILIKDREFISVNSNIDYYFKRISSNTKFIFGYTKSQFKNSINNSSLRNISSLNYNYGFELRSGFAGIFNYHFGTKWLTNKIKTTTTNNFTDNNSFLDLSFFFSDKFNLQVQSERYFFGNLPKNNTYYFLDVDATYKMIENKLTFIVTGKNLFNSKTFRNYTISDIGYSTEEFRLLPRFLVLKMQYRF